MESQQIMEFLQAMQEELNASNKRMLAEMREGTKADRKADHEEMMARMDANHEEMMTTIKAWGKTLDDCPTDIKNDRKETMAYLEKTEARLEVEPASVDTTPEVADDQEVQVEDAEVLSIGEPRKRRRDRHLAAGRRQKEDQNLDAGRRRKGKERIQSNDGYRKNLVAALRGTTRRVQVARHNFLSTRETRGYCGSQRSVMIRL
jgi:hypothetical protein